MGTNVYALTIKRNDNGVYQQHVMILCEQHYYTHLGLICRQCHEPILEPVDPRFMYHPQCLQCPDCITHDAASSFEYNGQVYCRYHFSLNDDTHCAGCNMAILKQFVEQQHEPRKRWHLTCYMIQKVCMLLKDGYQSIVCLMLYIYIVVGCSTGRFHCVQLW